jgi:ribosomal protein S18 acetylase RimI-like enzyme
VNSEPDESAFRIRRANAADAPRLARFLSAMFARTFGAQNRPADIAAYLAHAFGPEQQSRELAEEGTLFWIAEDHPREMVGCAQLRVGSRSKHVPDARQAELARVYADDRWHGQGLGRALLDTCVEAAREWKADVLWLGVWERNSRAIAFYEKNGFRVVGDQPFQLGSDRQRDLVMARDLGAA